VLPTKLTPDAVLKHLRNLEVGMVTVEYGKLMELHEHTPGWFNATWDRSMETYSHPGWLLVTVLLDA
jgi:hypothetical protein